MPFVLPMLFLTKSDLLIHLPYVSFRLRPTSSYVFPMSLKASSLGSFRLRPTSSYVFPIKARP